jgi:hypothetical protein
MLLLMLMLLWLLFVLSGLGLPLSVPVDGAPSSTADPFQRSFALVSLALTEKSDLQPFFSDTKKSIRGNRLKSVK